MKGVAVLTVNHDTMKEALAHWLNETQLKDDIVVNEVSWNGANGTFSIKYELKPEDPDT